MTEAAEHASEGCADAVRSALYEAKELIKDASSVEEAVGNMNMCVDTVPAYITELETLSELSYDHCIFMLEPCCRVHQTGIAIMRCAICHVANLHYCLS